MNLNRSWHAANPMPKNPTMAQRIDWHTHHAEACGCRPIPESIQQTIAALDSTGVTPESAATEETKYMVAIPVPDPLSSTLAELQQAYRNQRWHITIVPHITIIAPGYAAIGPEQAIALFQNLELPKNPPMIRLQGINHFHSRKQSVLYLEPSESDWLAEIHQTTSLMAETWQDTISTANRPYVPHLTVSSHLTGEETAQFERRLVEASLTYDFRPSELALFAKTPQELRWQRLTALKFANGLR